MPTTHEITKLLIAWGEGDQEALEQLAPLVEAELRRMARRRLAKERRGHVLQTAALVNEAYMRLINWKNVSWKNRAHFFAMAARMMRNILVDYAVKQRIQLVPIEEAAAVFTERDLNIIALNEALNDLAKLEPRQCRVVELKFFVGLTNEEVAEVLDVSVTTVKNDWGDAKAYLHSRLSRKEKDDA